MPKFVWYKSFDDEMDDPKIQRLNDEEYRVWRAALNFCNRSPYRARDRGYLYHSKGFPVEVLDFAFKLARSVDDVAAALDTLCEVGGDSSLLLRETNGNEKTVLRVRAWRKRQSGASGGDSEPEGPERAQEMPAIDVDVDVDTEKKRPSSPPKRRPKKAAPELTPDQKHDHTAAMAAFDTAMKDLTKLENPEGWTKPDKGHAAKFFHKRLLQDEDDGQDLLDCIGEYFSRQRNYEAEASAKGKTRHTAPGFTRFRGAYTSLLRAVEQRRQDAKTS